MKVQRMRILMCSCELSPLIRVGGISEVLAGLCQALSARGHRICVALPPYSSLLVPPEGIEVVTLDAGRSERGDPYGPEIDESGASFERLARYGESVLALCSDRFSKAQGFDVAHIHDWPMAFLPYLLRHQSFGFAPPRTVVTVHNARYLGLFPPRVLGRLGLPAGHASGWNAGEGWVSTLIAGIRAADAATTVSRTYGEQIRVGDFGSFLQAAWSERAVLPVCIENGIDVGMWDPERDLCLAAHYHADNLAPRSHCKRALLETLGVVEATNRPLLVSAARMFLEKGTDILALAAPRLVELGAQLVIAGTGSEGYERMILEAARRTPARVSYLGQADESLMRRLVAAADLVLIPSRYESCGLMQMYAQRYGSVPVAHRTGGLADTIVDEGEYPDEGSGFLFADATVEALVNAVSRALHHLENTTKWRELQQRCMRLQRDWSLRAAQYERLYNAAPAAY